MSEREGRCEGRQITTRYDDDASDNYLYALGNFLLNMTSANRLGYSTPDKNILDQTKCADCPLNPKNLSEPSPNGKYCEPVITRLSKALANGDNVVISQRIITPRDFTD